MSVFRWPYLFFGCQLIGQISAAATLADEYTIAGADSVSVQGGWDYPLYLGAAVRFAETLLAGAVDEYGPQKTPLWLSVMNPSSPGLIADKPANWQTYWDAEDYVMTAQGCNLYRDMPTLAALQELSRLTHDPKYQKAVQAYLGFFLQRLPGPQTGLFPWGEHMSYNTVRDKLIATRHEMEHNLPEWEMLWQVNPQAVQREIEAIYNISIYDKEKFLFDRHANYYTGAFDPAPVRGAYIKHSGLFTQSFLFLYSKTRDPKYLDWARKISNLYWQYRDPVTGIVPGYVSESGPGGNSDVQLLLANYLLAGVEIYPDPVIKERAIGMVDSFLKYGFNSETGEFAAQLVPTTGEAVHGKTSAFGYGESSEYYRLYTFRKAYRVTENPRYLQALKTCLDHISHTPLPATISPQAVGSFIDLFVDLYQLTGEKQYLQYARSLANWSLAHLVRNNLIIEAANGLVYHNYNRPGVLLAAWLKLYQEEQKLSLHWTMENYKIENRGVLMVRAKSTLPLNAITLTGRTRNGKAGKVKAESVDGLYSFRLKLPVKSNPGPVSLEFSQDQNHKILDVGQVLAVDDLGPIIGPFNFPLWIDKEATLTGKVKVVDAMGIIDVRCYYQTADSLSGSVACRLDKAEQDWYGFSIPAQKTQSDKIVFWLEATSNPGYPMKSRSAMQQVFLAKVRHLTVISPAGIKTNLETGLPGLKLQIQSAKAIDNACVQIRAIPVNKQSRTGLPDILLPGFVAVHAPLEIAQISGGMALQWSYQSSDTETILSSTLTAYRRQDGSWKMVPGAVVDHANQCVEIPCKEGGDFVLGGQSRLWWRRSFNGALMSSPAVARIDHQGRMAIILDTRDADGVLYALNAEGKTLWSYNCGEMQPFPAVADLDGDDLDEIVVGGSKLTVLEHDGKLRWQVALNKTTAPVIGDINRDRKPEIIAATEEGIVAAFTMTGKELFRLDVGQPLKIPVLGDLDGDGVLEIIVGGDKNMCAVSGSGKLLWRTALPGKSLYAPAAADLNQDRKDEIINFCRTDANGYLDAFDGNGKLLWEAVVSRESDWCPIVADLDATGEPRIVAQSPDPRKLELYNAQGKLVRTLATTGRALQTAVPLDLNNDNRLDLLLANDLSYRLWAIANDGTALWYYIPQSFTLAGAKIKGGGSLLVADINGDGLLEIVGGDDETWLHAIRTDTPCRPWQVISGQFHGDSRHSGNYMVSAKGGTR